MTTNARSIGFFPGLVAFKNNSVQKTFVMGGILFLTVHSILSAQRVSLDQVPALRERALVMRCTSRIVEQNTNISWDSEYSKVTLPGRPVAVRLVGSNLVILVQFTPFLRPGGSIVLLAHGQTWINTPEEGISYHTSIQTIPMEFNEEVYFFPLGAIDSGDEARIEIQVIVEPYTENDSERFSDNGRRENITPP